MCAYRCVCACICGLAESRDARSRVGGVDVGRPIYDESADFFFKLIQVIMRGARVNAILQWDAAIVYESLNF